MEMLGMRLDLIWEDSSNLNDPCAEDFLACCTPAQTTASFRGLGQVLPCFSGCTGLGAVGPSSETQDHNDTFKDKERAAKLRRSAKEKGCRQETVPSPCARVSQGIKDARENAATSP